MLRRRKVGAGLLIVALTASLIWPVGPASAAVEPAAAAPAVAGSMVRAGAAAHTVTLLTGDRVTVTDDGKVAIQRGKDRKNITFLTRRVDGHVHVVPSDALPLLRDGRLDSRLFDLTALIGFGYDDTRDNLPLVVTANPTARASARSAVTAEGATVVRELPAVNGLAVRAAKDNVAGLWQGLTGGTANARTLRGGVSTVWLDGLRKPSLDVSVPQIGAPAAWQAGYDGAGVKVAVLDTGIDETHPDLAGQVAAASNFTEGEEDDADRVGHGTHVASTIAGTGQASDGKYTGVAPKASLLDGKVCVEYGCAESWIVAGMQWAAEQGAAVVNLSLGGGDTPEVDPVEEALGNLTEQYGTLFVVAAGNSGADASISSPASADAALAVGAVSKTEELADFSSRGPRVDGGLKPDLTAPGVDIVAANSKDGFLGQQGESYTTLSGTSMATPHVAGAAAILAQRRPGLAPAELKSLLMGAARPDPALNAFAQGAGRVDVAKVINQTVTANPPGLGFGRQLWPHADDTPIARTVTYRNTGADALTLALSAEGTGPDGKPAPAGLFALSTSSLTVPAGGQASVTMTADTRIEGPDGYYTGRLTATGDGTSVVTPFAVDREVESYDVTISHIDRDGTAAGNYFTSLVRTDRYGSVDVYGPDGTVTLRVPKGPYALMSMVFTGEEGDENPELTMLAHPKVTVTGDQRLTVDARRGRPVSVTVPRADASPVMATVMTEVSGDDYGVGFGLVNDTFAGLYAARLGPDRAYPWIRSAVSGTFAKLDADGESIGSPFSYDVAWRIDDRMINGFSKRVTPAQLATVRAAHARQGPADAFRYTFPVYPEQSFAIATGLRIGLPFTRTEYYNVDGGVRWQGNMDEVVVAGDDISFVSSLYGPTLRYQAGRSYVQDWNRGVFGPSLLDPFSPYEYLTRVGDTMVIAPALVSDGEHRAGYSVLESARLSVYRDGAKVAEVSDPGAEVEVPSAAGDYRVEVDVTRGGPIELSTQVTSAWTFRSGHVSGDEPVRLPVSVVRFTPALSQHNTAPAGKAFTIPVVVQRQPDSPAAANASLTVQVSYDDGRTWRPARVSTVGGQRQVHVQHPDRSGFVSLRASATDTAGNRVEQTIIRAYRIVG